MSASAPLGGVLAAVRAAPRRGSGEGCILMLVAARKGEGVSAIARDAAREAACPVLLVDLDVRRNPQSAWFEARDRLGVGRDARIGARSLVRAREGAQPAFSFHRAGQSEVYVSRCEARGGKLQIARDAAYWDALRRSGALVVVDAPSLDRADLALALAPHMDAVVLVVASDSGAAPPAIAARAKLAETGAHIAGLVFARASAPVILLDRMTRALG